MENIRFHITVKGIVVFKQKVLINEKSVDHLVMD